MGKIVLLIFACAVGLYGQSAPPASCNVTVDPSGNVSAQNCQGMGINVVITQPTTPPPPTPPPPTPPPSTGAADNRYCNSDGTWIGPKTDGPATLPVKCFYTALAATPSPGAKTSVAAGSSLQTALNGASCGDTLFLAHGATFQGPFQFPAKACDDQHWITIRTDTPDSQLPAEGKRIDPSAAPLLAKIQLNSSAPASTLGDHVRFIGIEFAKNPASKAVLTVMLSAKSGGASSIIFDRTLCHGNPLSDETTRCLALNNSSRVGVIDSYWWDFHCLAPGSCSDSQAIYGGCDSLQSGTFKIVNNYLEAAAENILFGGCGSLFVPTDIEVRRNYLRKPAIWNPSDPSYAGSRYTVKNNFEIKNGMRVLFEGNTLERTWAGFSQVGALVLLTPKNQGTNNSCPICRDQDITLRYNRGSYGAQALQIANATDAGGYPPAGGYNYSIHDNYFDHMHYPTCYTCGNTYDMQITSLAGVSVPLHDVTIDHITIVPEAGVMPPGFMVLGGVPMSNIKVTNSVFDSGNYGVWSVGAGTGDCSYGQNSPQAKFTSCFLGSSSFAGNIVARGANVQQTKTWPANNLITSDDTTHHVGSDYHLVSTCPYKGKGTDGEDPGANIDEIAEYQ